MYCNRLNINVKQKSKTKLNIVYANGFFVKAEQISAKPLRKIRVSWYNAARWFQIVSRKNAKGGKISAQHITKPYKERKKTG